MNNTNHYYFISSYDKQSGQTDTNFTVIPHRFNDIKAIELKHVLIPYSFYNVNSTNNSMIINKLGDVQNRTITLTPGNYDINSFLVELKTQLDASAGPARTYTCTYSATTYKITIAQNTSTFSIIAQSSSLKHLLGAGSTELPQQASHTMPHVFDLSYTNIIKVYSSALTKFDSNFRSSNVSDSAILTVIPIHNVGFGGNIEYQFRTYHVDVHSMNEEYIDIRLLDKYNNPLGGDQGLNNKTCYMKLKFTTWKDTDERMWNKY